MRYCSYSGALLHCLESDLSIMSFTADTVLSELVSYPAYAIAFILLEPFMTKDLCKGYTLN